MGDIKIHAFHGGGEIADMSVFDPFHPDVGTKVEIPYFFYVVQHPDGNVLFDTGGHPDLIDNPRARLGDAADAFEVTMQEGDDVVAQLKAGGFEPSDIDVVVLSHLHYDHAGGIEFFPDATFYAQRRELEFAHWPPIYQREIYLPADFDHPVDWVELRGDHDLFGDGRLLIFPTPGHTAGHQSILVRFEEDRGLILVADAAYLPRNIDENILLFTHDLAWPEATRVAPQEWYE
jgi:N-acyl homoserine lactone hydrolase